MKSLFVLLLFGLASVAHAEFEKKTVLVAVRGGDFVVSLSGQAAKDVFDSMPKGSIVQPTKNCSLPSQSDEIIKVKGGFVCGFYLRSNNLDGAYSCQLLVSTKTGKALERKPHDICFSED